MKNAFVLFFCFAAFFWASCGTEKAAGKKIFVLQKIHEGSYYDLPSGVPELETKLQKRIAQLGIAEEDIELLAVQGKLHLEISQWSIYKKTVDEESIRQLITGQGIFSIWKTASAPECFSTMVAQTKLLAQADSTPSKSVDTISTDNVFWLGRITPPFLTLQTNSGSHEEFDAIQCSPFITTGKATDTLAIRQFIDSLQIIGIIPSSIKFAWKAEKYLYWLTLLTPTIPDGYIATSVVTEVKTFHGTDSLALLFSDKTAANWRRMVQKRKDQSLAFLLDQHVIGTVDHLAEHHTESISFANTFSPLQLQLIKIVIEGGALAYPLRIVTESEI